MTQIFKEMFGLLLLKYLQCISITFHNIKYKKTAFYIVFGRRAYFTFIFIFFQNFNQGHIQIHKHEFLLKERQNLLAFTKCVILIGKLILC